VAIEVVLAIDLETVLEVAPLVEVLATARDHEPAEQLALAIAKRIAYRALLGIGDKLHLAGVDGRRVGGAFIVDSGLCRPEPEQVPRGVLCRHAPARRS